MYESLFTSGKPSGRRKASGTWDEADDLFTGGIGLAAYSVRGMALAFDDLREWAPLTSISTSIMFGEKIFLSCDFEISYSRTIEFTEMIPRSAPLA